MRIAVVVVVLLLAGCSGEPSKDERPAEISPPEVLQVPRSADDLSAHLAANSTGWQEFLVIEDEFALGNDSIQFTTGRGMGCQGNADNVSAGNPGWAACMVRLASRPEATAMDVHELGIGYDLQRLTARQAAEPVEWRFVVEVFPHDGHHTTFDSGWRLVDLSPVISDPVIELEIRDPCVGSGVDVPVQPPSLTPAGPDIDAILSVELDATHGQPFVRIDLGESSRPGDGESKPYAAHGTGEHAFEAHWDTVGPMRNFTLALNIDLASAASPTGPMEGPCQVTVGRETQEWTVDVGIVGADGAVEFKTQKLQVDVYLDLA